MSAGDNNPIVYTPHSMNTLLASYHRNSDATLYAGGTWLLNNTKRRGTKLPRKIIALKGVDELSRVTRSERNLDIGACVPLSRIAEIGDEILPRVFHESLLRVGGPSVRNLATLGGNLAVPDRRMTLFPALLICDAKVELRSQGHNRWIPLLRLINADGMVALKAGELISRIRLPLTKWPFEFMESVHSGLYNDASLLTCLGLAGVQKEILTELRFVAYSRGMGILRFRDLEASLIGRKLPLPERDIRLQSERLKESLETVSPPLSAFIKKRSFLLYKMFLDRLVPVDSD